MTIRDLLTRLTLIAVLNPLYITVASDEHPSQPNYSSHDAVGGFPFCGVCSKFETQTAVDNADGDHGASEPDVHVGPDGAAVVLLVVGMVRQAAKRLDGEEADHDEADYGVVFIDLGCF